MLPKEQNSPAEPADVRKAWSRPTITDEAITDTTNKTANPDEFDINVGPS